MTRWIFLGSFLASVCPLAGLAEEPAAAASRDPAFAAAPGPAEPEPPVAAPAGAEGPQVLGEIEVKALREAGVETLEVREVRESPSVDLGEALANQGLVAKIRKGAIANDMVLRGFQRDSLPVTIDGAMLHGACPNRMDPAAFHVDYAEVDRVELKKGPYDVSIPGSVGGNVTVDTRRAKGGLNAEVNAQYGAFERFEGSAVLGYGAGAGDILGSYAYKYSQPYLAGGGQALTAIYPATSPNRYRDPGQRGTAYAIQTAWGQGGVSIFGKDRLQVAYAWQGADDVLYPYLLMDAVYDDTNRVNASYAVDFGAAARLQARFYWNGVDHLMNDVQRCSSSATPGTCSGALPRAYSMETLASASMTGGKLEASFGKDSPFRTGVDFYSRLWTATTTRRSAAGTYVAQASIPDVNVVDAGLYAEYAHRFSEEWKIGVGARVDWATSTARLYRLPDAQEAVVLGIYQNYFGPGMPLTSENFLLSGNVEADWQVSQPVGLYLGAGHGARVPDPQERYFALSGTAARAGRVGYPRLAPPQNSEIDLGVKVSTPRLLAKAQVFGSVVNDAIIVAGISGTDGVASTTYENILARLAGVEVTFRWALPLDLYLGAMLSFTYGERASPAIPLQEIPPLAGNLSLRWDDGVFFAEADAPWAAPQYRVDPTVQEQTTPGWIIANVRAGASWKGFKAFAGVTNLIDRYYVQYFNYLRDPFASGIQVPEPGRAFYVAVQYLH